MRYYNFDRLIDKYSSDFELLPEECSSYDSKGDLIKRKLPPVKMRGAIIGLSENKVYRSDGVLTARDKHLYTKESLGDITGVKVIYGGDLYSVEEEPSVGNSPFTGAFCYVLKFISVFGGGDDGKP